MTSLRLALLALLALLPAYAAAATDPVVLAVPVGEQQRTDLATLLVPEDLDVEQVDGMSWPGMKNVFRRGTISLRVTPGAHDVALQYERLFDLLDNQHEVVRSPVMSLRFVAEPGQVYKVVLPRVRNVNEAKAMARNFSPRIEDAAGNNRIIAASQSTKTWRGEAITARRDDLVNAALAASLPVAVAAPAVVAPVAAAPAATAAPAAAPAAAAPGALDMLKFSWQNASEADRAAFRAWIDARP